MCSKRGSTVKSWGMGIAKRHTEGTNLANAFAGCDLAAGFAWGPKAVAVGCVKPH